MYDEHDAPDLGMMFCPDCDGTGEITTPYRSRVDCVRCDGSGQILEPDPDNDSAEEQATIARRIQRGQLLVMAYLDDGHYYAAVDAIANICLWCHANGINASAVLDNAATHYREECNSIPTIKEN